MRLLLVAATRAELPKPLQPPGTKVPCSFRLFIHDVALHICVTGVGMVSAAVAVTRALEAFPVEAALQVGIAGSFYPQFSPGTLVQVRQETLGELGATSPEGFLTLEQLRLPSMIQDGVAHYQEFTNPSAPLPELPHASGLTVNTVSGTAEQIARRVELWQPQVESMEGAAFFQACLVAGVPFHQVRAISNPVTPRDRSKWDIPGALSALHGWLGNYLQNPVY